MPELTIPATETPVAAPPAVAPTAIEWGEDVKTTADYYGLTDYLPAAIRILEEVCPLRAAVSLEVSREPETAERRVVLVALMHGATAEQRRACFEAVIDRWSVELPTHVRRHATFILYRA